MRIICVDVGASYIKYGLMTEAGSLTQRGEIPSRSFEGAQKLTERVSDILKRLEADADAISLCVKGYLDSSGRIVRATDDIPGWEGFPLRQTLEESHALPIYILNDTEALGLGEACYGSMRSRTSFLCMSFGTGVGGILFTRSQVDGCWQLPRRAPEMGHILLHPDGRRCGCGRQGCFEAYASVRALAHQTACRLRRRCLNGRELMALYDGGNEIAKECINTWIKEIAQGLCTLTHVLAPQAVVLGGGIMEHKQFVEMIRCELEKCVFPTLMPETVCSAALGNRAGLYGCYAFALQSMKNLDDMEAFAE